MIVFGQYMLPTKPVLTEFPLALALIGSIVSDITPKMPVASSRSWTTGAFNTSFQSFAT
ncbi:hypothetical protein [Paenibacillus campi]|uniref:hypothetical protein n=1 Tax=Paenibacillus campi TaxID=3106031 RepID=UPI002AFDE2BE|nr:hypothetical protein [Paenibacillus sp. SGZ-1014]